MADTTATVRAPRLTENRLDDLDEVILSVDNEIAYLADAIAFWPKDHAIHGRFTAKRDWLVRARDWIVGKVAAERAQRSDA